MLCCDVFVDNSHWAGIHSMAEAKCAVKQLLSMVSELHPPTV